jgi:hypothetical protein
MPFSTGLTIVKRTVSSLRYQGPVASTSSCPGRPPCYRFEVMPNQNRERPYPEVAALAARVASLEGLRTVLDVGLAWTPEMAILHPELDVVGIGGGGAGRAPVGFSSRVDVDGGLEAISRHDPFSGMVVLTGPTGSLPDLEKGFAVFDAAAPGARVAIVATTQPELALAHLAKANLQPSFSGKTRASDRDEERSATLLVADRSLPEPASVPAGFRVVAIMTAFNEEDIVGPSIAKLVADGVGVYLIDNWSTDGTHAVAERFLGAGLVGLERFPADPTGHFELRSLLGRVEAVAASLDADWFVHHDADERRCGPWAGVGLRDALWRVDQAGFSAVDHTVLNYRPIDDGYPPGGDFEAYFRHFEFGRTTDLLLQVKAWKNTGPVSLAAYGGHEARFPGRRIFPYKFELKHYPIRSQAHGERKIFRDRVARWDPKERADGWHVHYDHLRPRQSFLSGADGLIDDRGPETHARFLGELLAGAGLADQSFPAWATGNRAGLSVYRSARRFAGSRTGKRLRWWPLLPLRVARKKLREWQARRAETGRA